ncbi:MAG: DEAD-box ATP-dependent RNA helicase CshA [Actinobacteria bacterium]|nr:DEAD-box ATP-dependent RNA helicase CshA [Actinomycetota bacterium]
MSGEKAREDLPKSKVNLAEFQEDAVKRAFSRLRKYRGVLVADSVGLGKTWIAKRIIEEFGFYRRRKFLVVIPAQLRGMWRDEIKDLILAESLLSQEELAMADFMEKVKNAVGGDLADVSLVVVDESHNFRNPLSNRWENFFRLLEAIEERNGGRPYIVFLTATPINNTLWDLYWQIMLLVLLDKRAFTKDGISDLLRFFKEVDKRGDPTLLADLLNEISIRRTRDYIKRNYPDAEIEGERIVFPERVLENVNYQLDASYRGMYRLISDILTDKLRMAYYRILEYKKVEKLSPEEQLALGRMIALEGIFRTILLKRLESSIHAFRKSIRYHLEFLRRLKEYLAEGKFLTKQAFRKYVVNLGEELPEDLEEELEDFRTEDYRMDKLLEDIDNDISLLDEILGRISGITPEEDAKLLELEDRLSELVSNGQVVVFTYYADTLDYIFEQVAESEKFRRLRIEKISGRMPPPKREEIVKKFMEGDVQVLMSTDVLSEGMNLQSAQFVINYDLHWNPTRMIQRSGRIDRIGSPYPKIFVYNFFPEEELEELLKLVNILQKKIRDIDDSIGLDETVLGEEVHPKVFGIIRRIHQKDARVFDELEEEAFGGGEKFYQPLREFLKTRAVEELEKIPDGVYSGLRKETVKGIFFYYQYQEDFHFWYLYDLTRERLLRNKSEILNFIACPSEEKRVIPDFFNKLYEANEIILREIEETYRELEQAELTDRLDLVTSDVASKFVNTMVREIGLQLDSYLLDFPEDREWERRWEEVEGNLLGMRLTKRKLRDLRKIWRAYKEGHKSWKRLMRQLEEFVVPSVVESREMVEPFDPGKLRLVVIDFIS